MRVRFWGVRGSIPTPGSTTAAVGGNTPCVQVTGDDGSELVLDAGSGIRALGADLLGRCKRLDILLTHLHLDHIQGLLFFAPLFDPEAEITVWGPPGPSPCASAWRLAARTLSRRLRFETCPRRFRLRKCRRTPGASASSNCGRRWSHIADPRSATGSSTPGPASATCPTTSPGWERTSLRDRRTGSRARPCARRHRAHPRCPVHRRGVPLASRLGPFASERHTGIAERSQPERLLLFHHDPGHDDTQLESLARQANEQSIRLATRRAARKTRS